MKFYYISISLPPLFRFVLKFFSSTANKTDSKKHNEKSVSTCDSS